MGLMRGISAPLVTPFKKDGSLDLAGYEALARYASSGGLAGIFVAGTTGEFVNLSIDERIELLGAARAGAGEKTAVMFNVTALNMRDVERMVRAALDGGIRVLSVTAPYYHVYRPRMLSAYFTAIAHLAPKALVYLYNMPGLTRNPITNEVLTEVVRDNPNVVGIKDSSMDFMTFLEYQQCVDPQRFDVLTGNDAQVLTSIQAGGAGAVVAMAGVVPGLVQGIWDDYFAGAHEKALTAQKKVSALRRAARGTMPILAHKAMLKILGHDVGGGRFPFGELEAADLSLIEKALKEALE